MPNYELDLDTQKIILGLFDQCINLNLGNVSFSYYHVSTDFYLIECRDYWEVVIKGRWDNIFTDVYRIANHELIFQYSEV